MLISKWKTENKDIEKEIAELENSLNIKLPEQYRKFLLRYNGGDTPKTEFNIKREASDVRYFLGAGNVEISFSKVYYMEDFLKKGILPIAEDSFGNYISVGIDEDNNGKVYFCDHEKGMRKKVLTETFVEFIRKCKGEKLNPHCRTIEERKKSMIEKGNPAEDWLRKAWQDEIERYERLKNQEIVILD